jgi:hypothetical protein
MTKILANHTFVHHVLFYLKNPNNEADRNKFMEGVKLLSTITTIQQLHLGTPTVSKREVVVSDYTFSLLCIFDSAEKEEAYQIDPIHDQFKNDYAHLWEKVVIYDSPNCLPS